MIVFFVFEYPVTTMNYTSGHTLALHVASPIYQGRVVRHDLQRLVVRFVGCFVVLLRFHALGFLGQVCDLGVAQRLDRELALAVARGGADGGDLLLRRGGGQGTPWWRDRKSTRLNSSH